MKPILLMEGNDAASRARAAASGVATASEVYAAAVRRCDPEITLHVVCAADMGSALPAGAGLDDYAGLIVGGSSLHAYDEAFGVTNQIALLKAAGEAGLPILGSCWGLQIAAVAGGGRVARGSSGREIGVARKIRRTAAGGAHPFLSGKSDCYDALCIHSDEVVALPADSVVLASNHHSHVQAAVVPVGRSQVWAVQYHPEFDAAHIASLLGLYADALVEEGFFATHEEQEAHRRLWETAASQPPRSGAAWRLGLDADTLDPVIRLAEIDAWLRHVRQERQAAGG